MLTPIQRRKIEDVMHTLDAVGQGVFVNPPAAIRACWEQLEVVLKMEESHGE